MYSARANGEDTIPHQKTLQQDKGVTYTFENGSNITMYLRTCYKNKLTFNLFNHNFAHSLNFDKSLLISDFIIS